jgi:hypothetical protein
MHLFSIFNSEYFNNQLGILDYIFEWLPQWIKFLNNIILKNEK